MNSPLCVANIESEPNYPYILECDEYVPLRLRTYDRPIGARYIRLGNYSTTLLELILHPDDLVVRGVTITCFDKISPWPEIQVERSECGLPILAARFDNHAHLDIHKDFQVSVRHNVIMTWWGNAHAYDVLTFSNADYLIEHGQLAGLRFRNLPIENIQAFMAQLHG